ncbi:hypothetical protein niasHT_027587 [Heterodera trifolii]|uniref:Uncharacterized protein n=1 Tax=Heterodera trifolii TaxID=157864 RepID=A0ABD2K582_9BILA
MFDERINRDNGTANNVIGFRPNTHNTTQSFIRPITPSVTPPPVANWAVQLRRICPAGDDHWHKKRSNDSGHLDRLMQAPEGKKRLLKCEMSGWTATTKKKHNELLNELPKEIAAEAGKWENE